MIADAVATDTTAAKETFDRDGYALIRGFFSPEEVRETESQLSRYIADILPEMPPNAAFYEDPARPETLFRLDNLHMRSRTFHALLQAPRVHELASALLGETAVPHGAQMFGKAPRIGGETPAHQDGYYFMLEPNEALTMWAPLDRTDEGNGCIRYVPGSHRRGMRPHGKSKVFGFSQGVTDYGDEDFATEVPIVAEPGDLIVHHSMTIHRADPNRSDRRRWALGLVFFGQSAKRDEAAAQRYREQLHREWAAAGKV